MQRFNKTKLYTILILLIGTFSIVFSSFSYLYYDASNDINNIATPQIDTTSKIVADNYYQNQNQPYASFNSLENAINDANSKSSSSSIEIYLRPSNETKRLENANIFINSNVSLYLPFEDKKWDIDEDSEIQSIGNTFVDTNSTNVSNYRKNYLQLINSTLTIQSGGALYIGGLFRTIGIGGKYAEIGLDENSKIIVNGTIINYGYIKEINNKNANQEDYLGIRNNEFDKERYIEVNNGGTLKTSISIYDLGGLSSLTGLNDNDVCPVNLFDFPSLQTFVKINYGAALQTQIRAYLSTSQFSYNVNQTGTIIASSTDAKPLFLLNSGYITIEYCPNTPDYTFNDSSKTFITINGDVDLEYLYFDLGIAGQTIDTRSQFIPISYKLDIEILNESVFTFNNNVKFLAGTILTIQEYATINIESEVIFYKSNSLANFNSVYPSNLEDAKLINNGNLILASSGKVAAYIETDCIDDSATINLLNATDSSLTVTSKEGTNTGYVSLTTNAEFYDEINETYERYLINTGIIIYSDATGRQCWANGNISSYTLTVKIISNYELPTLGYQVYTYDSANNKTSLNSDKYVTTTETQQYIIEFGNRFSLSLLDRAERTYFTSGPYSEQDVISDQIYDISQNMEVTIIAGEGVTVRFSNDGQSGSSGSSKIIYEASTANGNFIEIGSVSNNNGAAIDLTIKKNSYVKYYYKRSTANPLSPTDLGNVYLFEGIISVGNYDTYANKDNGVEQGNEEHNSSTFGNDSLLTSPILIEKESTLHVRLIAEGEGDDGSGGDGGGCVLPNTLITMADGTYKEVQYITSGDLIKAFDHETGKIVNKEVVFNDSEEVQLSKVINLEFSNGNNVGVVYEHGFFNINLNKYVYIDENNYKDYVGHKFLTFDQYGNIEFVKLTNAYINYKYTKVYSPVTYQTLNYFTNNILSLPGGIEGLFNIFDYNQETFAYDEIKKTEDINKYGLFTIEDFNGLIDEEIFNAFNGQYLKVAIAKDLISWEEIEFLVNRYSKYF